MTRALIALAAIALLASGCDTSDNHPSLAEAVAKTEGTGSWRLATVEARDGKPFHGCTGEAGYSSNRFHLRCSYNGSSGYQVIKIGRDTYVRFDPAPGVDSETKWYKSHDGSDSVGEAFVSRQMLTMLRGATVTTERVGEARVRGVDVVRHELEVYCKLVALDCDATTTVEVWVDDEDLIRRITVDDGPSSFTTEFDDFGAPVDIVRPAPADVVDVDEALRPRPCAWDFGEPVRAQQAVEAVSRHGFSVTNGDLICDAGSAQFHNASATTREGFIFCYVFAMPPAGIPATLRREVTGGEVTGFTLANLECPIIPNTPKSETTLERLEAALEELERQIRK